VKAHFDSLNSRDAFALRTPTEFFLWYGKGTGFDDSPPILKVADMLQGKRSMEVFDEGEEVPAFWNNLGGYGEYLCNSKFLEKYKSRPLRLFCFSCQTGRMRVSEIAHFYQTDLFSENVYLFDAYHEVYTWLGKRASESLYKLVLEFANRYVREMATRRKVYVPLIAAEEGEEPIEMTRHFHTWVTKQPFVDPVLAREEHYADLLFQLYKKEEKELVLKKQNEKEQWRRLPPLLKINWVEVIRKEIPELVLDHGETDSEEEYVYEGEEITFDDGEEVVFGEDGEAGNGYSGDEGGGADGANGAGGEGDEDGTDAAAGGDEEVVFGELPDDIEDDTPAAPEKVNPAQYFIDKVHRESKHYRLYHT